MADLKSSNSNIYKDNGFQQRIANEYLAIKDIAVKNNIAQDLNSLKSDLLKAQTDQKFSPALDDFRKLVDLAKANNMKNTCTGLSQVYNSVESELGSAKSVQKAVEVLNSLMKKSGIQDITANSVPISQEVIQKAQKVALNSAVFKDNGKAEIDLGAIIAKSGKAAAPSTNRIG